MPDEAVTSTAPATPSAPLKPRKRWWRWLLWPTLCLFVLMGALATALWVWSGRDDSLATVLRLAGAHVPLVSEQATGSLRRGGKVQKLVWDKDGMRVEVEQATLLWQPMALLQGQLQIDELSAKRIVVTDTREKTPSEPATGPPKLPQLPLGIEVKSIWADEFVWTGPPEVQARQFKASYKLTGGRHTLALTRLEVLDGVYQGKLDLSSGDMPELGLDLQGVVASPMPPGQAPLPVRASAQVSGPLADLVVKLQVAADPAALAELPAPVQAKIAQIQDKLQEAAREKTGKSVPAGSKAQSASADADGPSLDATARLTPWQAPFLPSLTANFKALDVAAFVAQAPRTGLQGHIEVQPLAADTPLELPGSASATPTKPRAPASANPPTAAPASAAGKADASPAPQHWRVQAEVSNTLAGPIDTQRLPVNTLNIDADWRDGLAVVRQLQAKLADGELHTVGQWRQPPATSETGSLASPAGQSAASTAQPSGSIEPKTNKNGRQTPNTATPSNLGEWQLNTELSGINPQAIHSQLDAFPLDGTVQAKGQNTLIGFDAKLTARPQRALTRGQPASTLQALALRELQAQGEWTGSLLKLDQLLLKTADAQVQGSGEFDPSAQGGAAKLDLSLPGASAKLDGALRQDTGQGQLNAHVSSLPQLQAWLARLPGMPDSVRQAQAQGTAELKLGWRGGWAKPQVDLALNAPSLRWLPGGQPESAALGTKQLQLALQGGLDQATLRLTGQALQGERVADIALQANGGRSTPQRTLAESNWRVQVSQLNLDLRDPALGKGTWQARLSQAVSGQWLAAQGKQAPGLLVDAGQLSLTSPAPSSQAQIAWDPVRWQNGQLSTSGRISKLPLAWAEHVAGDAMRNAGVSGDVIFDGNWNAQLGQQLKLQAGLTRTSGDLTVLRKDPATGIESRIKAGLREARLTVNNEGERIHAQLRWDSSQLGTATGDVSSRLSAQRSADGHTSWTWPDTAPLDGRIQLNLPRVNAWSVLAPPGWRIHGSVTAEARIAGTRAQPLITGTLGADDLAMRSVVDGLEFGRGRLRARLDGQRLLLDEFSLHGAGEQGGLISAKGEASVAGGAPTASLTIQLAKLRASIRDDRQVTVSGQIAASLADQLTQVDGKLTVDHALIVLPEESAPKLGSDVVVRGAKDIAVTRQSDSPLAKAPATTPAPAKASQPSDLKVQANVALNLGEDFRVRGLGIDTKLKGELNLVANGPITAMPRLTGDVRTVGGTFRAYNQNLNIQRGLIRFTGAIDNPTLDIRAIRPNYASEQRVGVQVQGTALLPAVTLYSNPNLPDTETLAWLLLGRAAPDTGAEAAMLQSAAMAVLGGKDGKSLASRFGLDELSFGTGNGGSTNDASVTLGKRLSDNLYASYERSLSGVTGTLMIYLELTRRWTVRAQAGEDNAIDLLFRLSYD